MSSKKLVGLDGQFPQADPLLLKLGLRQYQGLQQRVDENRNNFLEEIPSLQP